MSIDNYLIDLAKSTATDVSTDLASALTPKIEPVEESAFSKVGLLQGRTQQKLANLSSKSTLVDPLKYNPVQTSVQSMTVTDADTVNLSGTGAMRVLNANAYETTKQDKWFEEPRNVLRMEKQRNELAGELGVPAAQVTNDMVFKVGEQQKQNVQNTMQGTVRDSEGKLLPSLVSADVATNRTGLVEPTNNYGRDLGAVTKLGGMYSTIDAAGNITGENNGVVKLGDTPNKMNIDTALINLRNALRTRESSDDYSSVNKLGYTGAYQFGAARLADLGMVKPGTTNKQLNEPSAWTGKYGVANKEQFLQNPEVQDAVMNEHLKDYAKKLSPEATSMEDLTGKIAAAHLLGVEGAKDLNAMDANKTTGKEYYELGKLAGMSIEDRLRAETNKKHAGSASEYVDRVQGSLAKVGADAANMIEKLVGKENIDKYNTFASDVEKYFGGDGDVGYIIGAKGEIKGTDKNIQDFRNREVAAIEMGVTQETLDKHNAAMTSGLKDWEKAESVTDYIKVMARMVPEVPGILADSAGEMAGLMIPGGIGLVAATRTSNYAEEFKKNNDRDMTPGELARTFFGELAVLAPEKVLIKTGVAGVFGNLSKGGRATKIATAAGGEGLQELAEGTTEKYATQKVGDKTLLEIATDPEQTFGAALGVISGGGLASTGIVKDVVSAVPGTVKKGIGLATEIPLQKDTLANTSEDIEEPIDLKAKMSNIMSRVAENGVISTADMTSIKKMEEQLISTPEEAQEQKLATINSLKDKYKAQLLDPENDTVVLKSKRDLMYAMQDIGEVDDAVDEVLYAKAVKAGIVKDKEEYIKVKKDFAVVDAEAKSGRIGYLTLTRDLENLLDASSPNTGKVDKLVKRLINYEKTQQDYLNKGTELYNRVQKEIEAYNAPNETNLPRKTPKSASSVEMDNGYKFTVYTELDANGKVQIKSNKALQDILEAKRLNIVGIKEGLQSVAGKLDSIGLSAADTGVTNKPIINAKGNKWLDAFAKDLKGSESTPEATHIYAIGSGKRATAIKESNLSGTNLTDYTKDSVVYMTMDKATTQDDVDKLRKELSNKKSDLHKAIEAAKEAGATIRLDATLRPKSKDKAGNAVKDPHALEALRLLQEALTNYGNEYRSVPSETSNFSFTFKPKAEAETLKESAKKVKEAKEAVTKKVDVEGYKEYRNLDSVKAQEAYAKSLWNSDEAIQAQYKSTDTKEGWEKLLNRFHTISANSVKEISAELSKANDLEKQIKDTTGLTGVDKTQAVMFNEDIENQIAELKATIDKKYAKKDYVIAETNAKETSKHLESIGDIIQEIKEIAQNTNLDEEAKAAAIQELLKDVDGDVAKTILDTSISKGKKTDTYKNYIVPLDINNIVKVGKNTVLSVAPVEYLFKKLANHPEMSSVRYIDDMKKAFEKLFVVNADKPYVKGEGGTLELQLRTESAVGLFYNKAGELNDTMLMAGQLALDEYMANNGEMLNPAYKSRENIAQMLGVIESQLGKNQEKLLRDKGMFYKTAANKVGKAALQKMGYVLKKEATDVEREAYDRLAADVGNRILLAGVANGILERDSISSNEYGEAIAKDSQKSTAKRSEFVDSDADIAFIKFTKKFIAKNKDEVSKRNVRADVYREIHSLIGDENSFRKMPSENPIKTPRYKKEQVAKDIAGMQIPGMVNTDKDKKTPAQFMEHLVGIKWEVNNALIAKMLKDVNIDVLKMHLGYASAEDLNNMSFDSKESAEAKNMDIEKSIEELKMFVDEKGQMNAELYFDWFYSSNGRYMMDSNTLNPQTDKLHRFLIQPAEHKLKYTVKDGKFTKKSMESLVNYAIAQAFGFKVDKKSTVKIMKAGELLRKADPKALSEVLFGSKGKNGVKDVHTHFKLTEDGTIILPTTEGYKENPAMEFEPDHISHTLQAIDMLEKIKKGGTFTSSLTAEFDALTSGFGLKLLQIPIIGNELVGLWDWLNKVGVLEKGKATANSMNDILDGSGQKFYDSYQTLAKEVAVTEESVQEAIANKGKNYKKLSANVVNSLWNDAGLGALMPKVSDDGTVTSALRSLFKDPFMTFNYSAGIASIKRSLAGVLTSGLIDRIVAGEKGTEQPVKALMGLITADKNNSYKVPKTIEEFQQLLKEVPLDRIKVKSKNLHTLEEYLNEVMDLTYGHSVETIMKEHFQEFMDVHDTVNSAFKIMFTAWKQEYDKEVKQVPIGKLNDDKVKEILDRLKDKFPLIKSPLSDELNEGVAIYKSSSLTPSDEEVRYMPSRATTDATAMKSIGVKNKETGEGVASVKVRHMIRTFEAAISSGSVVPIHYIDGALMAQLNGEAVTAIHDAIMPPLNKSLETIKKYNQAMFDISKSYSWIKEINEMLKRLDVNTLDNTVKVEVKEKADGKTTYLEKGLKDAVEEMQSKLEALTERVTTAREDVFAQIGAIGHMVGLPGSMWTAEGVKLVKVVNKQETSTIDEEKVILAVSIIAKEWLSKNDSRLSAPVKNKIKTIITEAYGKADGKQAHTKLATLIEETCK
jgi:hypothetical protein